MEELQLYEGRPADCTGRLEKEIRTYDLLDKLGIPVHASISGRVLSITDRYIEIGG